MKMILLLVLAALQSRRAAAEKIEDSEIREFAKRLATAESRLALERIL